MDIKEELFREDYLFTREDILKLLELFMEHEKLNEENGYLNEVVKNRVKLCKKFIVAVKKCKLPVLTEPWWFYEYQFTMKRLYQLQMNTKIIILSLS